MWNLLKEKSHHWGKKTFKLIKMLMYSFNQSSKIFAIDKWTDDLHDNLVKLKILSINGRCGVFNTKVYRAQTLICIKHSLLILLFIT